MSVLNLLFKPLLSNHFVSAGIVLLITVLFCWILHFLAEKLVQYFNRITNGFGCIVVKAVRKPFIIFVMLAGITYALEQLHHNLALQPFQLFRSVIFIILSAWFLWRCVALYSNTMLNRQNKKFAQQPIFYAIGKISKITIVVISLLSLLRLFGLSLSGVLAIGGMGGILIGIASKDLLANIFGSLMLFLDRPFSIGDRIVLPALKVEGQVQDIGWRVCRLLSSDCRPIYVPNALFSNLVVENQSRMKHRRFSCVMKLRYQDNAKIPLILSAMQSVLEGNNLIDKKCPISVNLVELANTSLNISVSAFTRLVDSTDFLTFQQTLYLQLLDCMYAHGAQWSYPV